MAPRHPLIKSFLAPLLWLAYWLSGLFPRNPRIIVFGSHSRAFSDNAKYAYIAFQRRLNSFERLIWMARDRDTVEFIRNRGGEAYLRKSLMGVVYSLRAKFWIVSGHLSDINFYLSRNAVYVNTWHGSALKHIEFDIAEGPLAERYQSPSWIDRLAASPQLYRAPDILLSASPEVTRVFSDAFRVSPSRCLEIGYPRNDCLSGDGHAAALAWQRPSLLTVLDELQLFRKVWIYMPTFRDHNPDFLAACGLSFSELNDSLRASADLLLLKLHPSTPARILAGVAGLSNIRVLGNGDDVYPILPRTYGLITDYSSIFLDYLLLDKPIIFFAFDLDDYLSRARGMYYPYEKLSPGAVVKNASSLAAMIRDYDGIVHAEAREQVRSLFFTCHATDGAGDALVKSVLAWGGGV